MATTVLVPSDRLTVAFFDVGYHQMWHNAPVANVLENFQRLETKAARLMGQANGAAVWDNALKALQSIQKTQCGPKDKDGNIVLRYMVTFTDGEDNCSSNSLAAVVEAFRAPGMSNFNYLAMCVGAVDVFDMIYDAFELGLRGTG
ncbi:VWFA domain-containing protein, partial [Haematococcus lacustris]